MNDLYKKLSKLKEVKTLRTFFFDTEFSVGIVAELTQMEFSITNIAFDGTEDGITVFDVELLTKIRCGTNFENRISFLNKISHNRRSV
ncbi:MAG TPA: hypothetical protein VK588_13760 [Chitinophagaceae bacterium]|nr:hypothetical protein [Chitinophagaceae bacterium]